MWNSGGAFCALDLLLCLGTSSDRVSFEVGNATDRHIAAPVPAAEKPWANAIAILYRVSPSHAALSNCIGTQLRPALARTSPASLR